MSNNHNNKRFKTEKQEVSRVLDDIVTAVEVVEEERVKNLEAKLNQGTRLFREPHLYPATERQVQVAYNFSAAILESSIRNRVWDPDFLPWSRYCIQRASLLSGNTIYFDPPRATPYPTYLPALRKLEERQTNFLNFIRKRSIEIPEAHQRRIIRTELVKSHTEGSILDFLRTREIKGTNK